MIGETFWKTFLAALFFFLVAIQFSFAQDAVSGVKVPDGFEIIKVAGDDLATNVFCMAVSPGGEAFVSGPGYIKALVDSDGDGVFDGREPRASVSTGTIFCVPVMVRSFGLPILMVTG